MNDFPTFDEILEPKRKLLEGDIQGTCVKWAKRRGWWARKFQSPANRAVPDYIFGRDGFTLFVEFKAPGKKATDDQQEEHNKMLAVGLSVHVIDDIAAFKALVTLWERQMVELSKALDAAPVVE